jgi:hypothetical protein
MPLDITFTLSDSDLEHFQAIVDKSKSAVESDENAANIEAAARQLIADAKSTELPSFIADRLSKLEVVIDMVADAEWQLNDEERRRVLGALVYFCDPEDLIPDHMSSSISGRRRKSGAPTRAWIPKSRVRNGSPTSVQRCIQGCVNGVVPAYQAPAAAGVCAGRHSSQEPPSGTALIRGCTYVATKSPGAILDNAIGVSPKG